MSCVGDDGNSWDEYFHFPAYMDCNFLKPFHELNENFLFALEDIARMNDFRVRVNVTLESRESTK